MKKNSNKRLVIIGGGIAGLTAGIYGKKAGFDTVIIEKNAVPGGECMGWNRKGFHIDNCIHWLTGTKKGTELYDVWKTVGALSDDTEYVPMDAFYSSRYEGQEATLWVDLERTERELVAISPEDEEEIRKFIKAVEYSKQCLVPAHKPMEMWGISDYIKMGSSMKDFPKVMKEYGKISLEEYAKRFRSPLLQKLMCDYLPKEYATYALLVSYATVVDGNGDIPVGASLQMVLRMEKKYCDLGGQIWYNKSVDKVQVDRKKVTSIVLEDGENVPCDYVVPAIDTYTLFNRILGREYMPKELARVYEDEKAYPTTSGFQAAFAVEDGIDVGRTIFLEIEPLRCGNTTISRMFVKFYGYDDIFRADGKQVMQISILQRDRDYESWKAMTDEEYRAEKEKLVREIQRRLVSEYPELAGKMEFLDAWTPLTYERYCNAYHGSYMSFVTTPGVKQFRMKGKLKGLDNVFVAGQWTMGTGGLPVAVTSGKFAIQRILKSQKRSIEI
ncbi:phytoene desaturase family protein [Eubacterium xylanophilum]|uniref:phytoene desaturase family protein n=1 Tax=Eubacterium xylanophilum TaxID=39497 RepID=UPI0012EC6EFC|nr:NAD(P)/FAD-dependent oxidoreductase [Eubacterium xylanophilum]